MCHISVQEDRHKDYEWERYEDYNDYEIHMLLMEGTLELHMISIDQDQ